MNALGKTYVLEAIEWNILARPVRVGKFGIYTHNLELELIDTISKRIVFLGGYYYLIILVL